MLAHGQFIFFRESPLLVWNPFVVVVVFTFAKGRLPVCSDFSICSLGTRSVDYHFLMIIQGMMTFLLPMIITSGEG